MNDGDKFCPGCGAAAGQPAPTAPAPQPAPEASAKKKKISGGTIFVIIIMLFIVGAGLYMRNSKNSFGYNETTINGTTYQLTYDGAAKKGKPDGKGVLTAKSTDINYKYDGEFSDGMFTSGTMTIDYLAPGIVSNIVFEGDFSDYDLSGNGTRTISYTKDSYSKDGVKSEELVSDFKNGIPSGDSELTIYFSKDFTKEIGADSCVFSGKYRNGELTEPFDVTYYSGSTVVMKGTREGGIFEPDDAYKSTAEKLFEEFVDEYGLVLEGIEFIGEGLSNLFR